MRADQKAEFHGVGATPRDFYDYLVESLTNGNRSQYIELFNDLHKMDQHIFLTEYLDTRKGIALSAMKIAIKELINP